MFSLRFVYVLQSMALRKENYSQNISQRIICIGVSNAVRFSYFEQMLQGSYYIIQHIKIFNLEALLSTFSSLSLFLIITIIIIVNINETDDSTFHRCGWTV